MNPNRFDLSRTSSYGPLLLRVALGIVFLAHAYAKAAIFTFPGTEQYFAAQGFPAWTVYPVFAAELLGGIALLLGLYARQAALALVPVMAVAAWVHVPNGWVHTSTGGGWEYPVFLLAASIALWLLGDGAAAIKRSALFVPRPRAA